MFKLWSKIFLTLLIPVFIAFIFLGFYIKNYIYVPYKETNKLIELFANGYTIKGVYEIRNPISFEIEEFIKKVKELFYSSDMLQLTKRQAEYLALQNQINPHFLYNTLEGIRSEAIAEGLDSVAVMTESLASYFRYTISNVDHLVTLKDELMNIENYFYIQKFRFGERINLKIDYEEYYLSCLMPKLILQPIVENAIIHGIENKIEPGTIKIKTEVTEKRLLITISDDGVGIDTMHLKNLDNKLNTQSFEYINQQNEHKGGIAMINVNNRIKLLFGEEYGIHIYSTKNVGTDVEISLPLLTEGEIV